MTRDNYGLAYHRSFDLTVRFLASRGIPIEEARECSQEAWVKGWEKLDQLYNEDRVGCWINSIALNVYRGVLRKRAVEIAQQPGPSRTEMNLATLDLARILDSSSPRDRLLLQQRIRGLTDSEIALREGVSRASIRIRFMRARVKATLFVQGKKRSKRC